MRSEGGHERFRTKLLVIQGFPACKMERLINVVRLTYANLALGMSDSID
jgi:hypothetical protein